MPKVMSLAEALCFLDDEVLNWFPESSLYNTCEDDYYSRTRQGDFGKQYDAALAALRGLRAAMAKADADTVNMAYIVANNEDESPPFIIEVVHTYANAEALLAGAERHFETWAQTSDGRQMAEQLGGSITWMDVVAKCEVYDFGVPGVFSMRTLVFNDQAAAGVFVDPEFELVRAEG
jgi:hypothetical protein